MDGSISLLMPRAYIARTFFNAADISGPFWNCLKFKRGITIAETLTGTAPNLVFIFSEYIHFDGCQWLFLPFIGL